MAGKLTQQTDSTAVIQKRRYCVTALTMGMPAWYLIKNRNVIYKSNKLMREFHYKEVFARSILGFFVGVGASVAFYGLGPFSHREAPSESVKEQRE